MAGVMQVFQDVGDGETREVSVVLDGLHPGIQPTELNVAVWDLRHNSDHIMVIGCLNGSPPRGNTHVTLGARRAYYYIHLSVRQGHGQTRSLLSFGVPPQIMTNG